MQKHFTGLTRNVWFSAFAVALLLLLAACGSSPATGASGGSTPTAAPTATPTPVPTTAPTQAPTATASTGGTSVTIASYAFSPQSLTIKVGTKITWTNNDGVAHTVTSDNHTTFNSGPISPGSTYSFTFTKAGTYTYHCSIHPTMTATIVVQ